MHKFKIPIEIPDKDYCNGCPFVIIDPRVEANHYLEPTCYLYNFKQLTDNYVRLDICKQNDKEQK